MSDDRGELIQLFVNELGTHMQVHMLTLQALVHGNVITREDVVYLLDSIIEGYEDRDLRGAQTFAQMWQHVREAFS